MAVDPRLVKILEALLARTRANEIDWTESSRAERFIYSTSSGSVAIQTRDQDTTAPYELVIFNNAGQPVELLSSSDQADMPILHSLRDLYQLAFRAAARVDKTLDGILTEVQGERASSGAESAVSTEPPF